MAPAVKRLLPPASSSGARSSTSTDTPCSAPPAPRRARRCRRRRSPHQPRPEACLLSSCSSRRAHTTRDRPGTSRSSVRRNALSARPEMRSLQGWPTGSDPSRSTQRYHNAVGEGSDPASNRGERPCMPASRASRWTRATPGAVGQDQGDGPARQGPARHGRCLCRMAGRRPRRRGGLYESKEAADAAVARIQAIWGNLAGLLSGAPRTDAYENAAHITG